MNQLSLEQKQFILDVLDEATVELVILDKTGKVNQRFFDRLSRANSIMQQHLYDHDDRQMELDLTEDEHVEED